MWPAGTHQLQYAIGVYDTYLPRFFTPALEKPPNTDFESTEEPNFTNWGYLPPYLRAEHYCWSSDQIELWEALVGTETKEPDNETESETDD